MYDFCRAVMIMIVRLIFSYSATGEEIVPKSGPVIIASNHRTGWDPVFVAIAVERHMHFMAKVELFRYPVLKELLPRINVFPVRRGQFDRSAVKHALSVLSAGEVLGIFPEGTRHRDGQLGDALSGVAYFAWKTGAVVIPAAVVTSRGFRPRVRVKFGSRIELPRPGEKVDSALLERHTKIVMDRIRDLVEDMTRGAA